MSREEREEGEGKKEGTQELRKRFLVAFVGSHKHSIGVHWPSAKTLRPGSNWKNRRTKMSREEREEGEGKKEGTQELRKRFLVAFVGSHNHSIGAHWPSAKTLRPGSNWKNRRTKMSREEREDGEGKKKELKNSGKRIFRG